MFDLVKNIMFAGIGALYMTKEKAEEIVNELIAKGQLSKEEKSKKVKELMEKAEEKVKEVTLMIETQVEKAMDKINKTEKKEIEALKQKVQKLTDEMDKIKNKL